MKNLFKGLTKPKKEPTTEELLKQSDKIIQKAQKEQEKTQKELGKEQQEITKKDEEITQIVTKPLSSSLTETQRQEVDEEMQQMENELKKQDELEARKEFVKSHLPNIKDKQDKEDLVRVMKLLSPKEWVSFTKDYEKTKLTSNRQNLVKSALSKKQKQKSLEIMQQTLEQVKKDVTTFKTLPKEQQKEVQQKLQESISEKIQSPRTPLADITGQDHSPTKEVKISGESKKPPLPLRKPTIDVQTTSTDKKTPPLPPPRKKTDVHLTSQTKENGNQSPTNAQTLQTFTKK